MKKTCALLFGFLNIGVAICVAISAIWLAILGEWWTLGYGIVGLFAFLVFCGLAGLAGWAGAMISARFLMLPMGWLDGENKKGFGVFFFFLSLYAVGSLTAWSIGVLYFFAERANEDSIIPTLFWSYFVAVSSLHRLGMNEEPEFDFYKILYVFAGPAYVLAAVAFSFFGASLSLAAALFGAVMFIGCAAQSKRAYWGFLRLNARLKANAPAIGAAE